MKIIEILSESQYSHDIFNILKKDISSLNRINKNFDDSVSALGFEKASIAIKQTLENMDTIEWYYQAETDSKINSLNEKRRNLINELNLRLKNGL